MQRQGGGAGRQQGGVAEELGGDPVGALGEGGAGGEQLAVDGVPVQLEGAVQFGRVGGALGGAEAVAALGGGVHRVAEQQGLLGGEELGALGPAGRRGGAGAVVGEDVGGADHRVGDPGGEVGDLPGVGPVGGRGGEQGRGGDGVHRGPVEVSRRAGPEGGRAEPVPAGRRPVPDGGGEPGGAAEDGDPQVSVRAGRGAGLTGPAAQQGLHGGLFGGNGRVRVEQPVGRDRGGDGGNAGGGNGGGGDSGHGTGGGRGRGAGPAGRDVGRGSGEGGAQCCSLVRVECRRAGGGENLRALAPSRQVRVTYP